MRKNKPLRAFFLPLLVAVSSLYCQVAQAKPRLQQVVAGLGVPWGMTFLDAHTLLISERGGKVKRLDVRTAQLTTLTGSPKVWAKGQGGMLDVAVPPAYTKNGWVYFTYSKAKQKRGVTVLARAKLQGNRLGQWQELLVSKSGTTRNLHFGSRIAFDGKGHVFFTVGDRGVRPNGQDLSTHAGSVLRVRLDGSVPADNPFVNNPKALPEIWSYGHRNPQGLAYDRKTQRLWLNEHGPRGGDEINLIRKGKNYGWPVISYGKEYWGPVAVGEATAKKGMEQPVKYYVPSIAPGSLLLYSGKAYAPWAGNLLSGALKLRHLNRVVLNAAGKPGKEQRLFATHDERIRALAESPSGQLYVSTDSGKIFKVLF